MLYTVKRLCRLAMDYKYTYENTKDGLKNTDKPYIFAVECLLSPFHHSKRLYLLFCSVTAIAIPLSILGNSGMNETDITCVYSTIMANPSYFG